MVEVVEDLEMPTLLEIQVVQVVVELVLKEVPPLGLVELVLLGKEIMADLHILVVLRVLTLLVVAVEVLALLVVTPLVQQSVDLVEQD
tara:strand:+ start:218 stop:481 length:264 start_codon:yes stop_codon:yes gene_type:complete